MYIGVGTAVTFDGCSSSDPDDPHAACVQGGGGCGALRFEWTCAVLSPSSACATPPSGQQTNCTWGVEGGAFGVGSYLITLAVRKFGTSERASSHVVLNVSVEELPAVYINLQPSSAGGRAYKPSASERLHLSVGSLSIASAPAYSYLWSISNFDETALVNLSSPTATSTGERLSSLVMLPNVLRVGSVYTFQVERPLLLCGAPWLVERPSISSVLLEYSFVVDASE